jgi:RNA polymerase sigma-70 factor (ECF subfamily)
VPDTILQRVARGENAAVAACLDEFGGMVWGLADRYLRPLGEDIEDAVQDVFVEVWKSAGRFDPALGSEAAFIATIAHHRLIDRVRRAARRPTLHVDDPGTLAEAKIHQQSDHAANRDDLRRAAEAFNGLDKDEQQALWYSLYHGVPHEKIATLVQAPVGTVKSRIRRGLIRMREAITGTRKEVAS